MLRVWLLECDMVRTLGMLLARMAPSQYSIHADDEYYCHARISNKDVNIYASRQTHYASDVHTLLEFGQALQDNQGQSNNFPGLKTRKNAADELVCATMDAKCLVSRTGVM